LQNEKISFFSFLGLAHEPPVVRGPQVGSHCS